MFKNTNRWSESQNLLGETIADHREAIYCQGRQIPTIGKPKNVKGDRTRWSERRNLLREMLSDHRQEITC